MGIAVVCMYNLVIGILYVCAKLYHVRVEVRQAAGYSMVIVSGCVQRLL